MRDSENFLENIVNGIMDELSDAEKMQKEAVEARYEINAFVDDYISYAIIGLKEEVNFCEKEFNCSPKLKSLKIPTVLERKHNEDIYNKFDSISDFIYCLRTSNWWKNVSLINKMTLKILSKDEKKLERFKETKKGNSLNV